LKINQHMKASYALMLHLNYWRLPLPGMGEAYQRQARTRQREDQPTNWNCFRC
jgi:hypothetical protein